MKLEFFRGKDYSNFGDELNPYIFHHIFKNCFEKTAFESKYFYGIGSIIDQRICENNENIIFGTGIRDITLKYNTTTWDIRFVRGPITANALNLPPDKVVADAAYCLLTTPELLPPKKPLFKYSIMPHYRQMDKLNWRLISILTGVKVIDPRKELKVVLREVASTQKLISVAMHGAIVADIYRIPWHRLKMEAVGSEDPFISDLKWLDFLSALGLEKQHTRIKTYSGTRNWTSPWFWITYIEIIRQIKQIKKSNSFQISSEQKINDIKSKLIIQIKRFQNDYNR